MSPLFIVLLVVAVASAAKKNCPKHEEWTDCGSLCTRTCKNINNPDPIICPAVCVTGCVCKKGYLRNERDNNKCVRRNQCNKVVDPIRTTPKP